MAALGDSAANFPIEFFADPYAAAANADALLLCTEWRQYRSPDFARLREIMAGNALFDGRNQWERKEVEAFGFVYSGIGR
jgi:UDPglucose 6-dehydrogenase